MIVFILTGHKTQLASAQNCIGVTPQVSTWEAATEVIIPWRAVAHFLKGKSTLFFVTIICSIWAH